MNRTSRFALGASAAAAAGAVVLAACGGSGTTHTAAPAAATSATTEPAASPMSQSGPTVTTKRDAKLGSILADASGLTLYTLTNNGRAVDCTGACAAVWRPLTASSGAAPTAGPGAGILGTASLSDGTRVVTSSGLPLYRFSQDHDAGDAYGEGLASFGGVWHVVKIGQPSATSAAAPAVTHTAPSATMYKPTMSGRSSSSSWGY
jgi:predicted lipoprotein with Yx(FWY)xxD motif